MTDANFESIWNRLHLLFGLAIPRGPVRDICQQLTRQIPDEVIPHIRGKLDDLEAKPRNVSGWIRGQWYDWQREHPERMRAENPKIDCKYCWGDGYFYVSRAIPEGPFAGRMYAYIAKCAHCKQELTNNGDPGWTRAGLQMAGYTIKDRERSSSSGGKRFVDELRKDQEIKRVMGIESGE